MKKEKVKKLLLPIGLLIIGVAYFTRYFARDLMDIKDFLIGLGFAFVLSALFFNVFSERFI